MGDVISGLQPGTRADIYLRFDTQATGKQPQAVVNPAVGLRIDAFFIHGQEAAAIRVLDKAPHVTLVFDRNASDEAAFELSARVVLSALL